jgi:hypothetical protein
MTCRGITASGAPCAATALIQAHIIPRGFARDIMGGHQHNMRITANNVGVTQHGVYDPQILCASCDGALGLYDDYAVDVSRRFLAGEHVVAADGTYTLSNVDGDLFAKFALAVLWRASVTSRPEFRSTRLGPYEDKARDVLFGAKPLVSLPQYQLMAALYRPPAGRPVDFASKFYSSPALGRVDGLTCWQMSLGGLKLIAKLDNRPFDRVLQPSIINGNNKIFGATLPLEDTLEHCAMLQMAGAEIERKRQRTNKG